MFGGMHRLHELSDKEKLYKRIVNGLYGNECTIEDVELNHTVGEVPTLSCNIKMPYKDDAADSIAYHYFCGRGNGKSRRIAKEYMDYLEHKCPRIEKVIFNDPVTVILWSDKTKTIVRCNDGKYDPEKGMAMAVAKKFLGTNDSGSNYYDVFKKWLPEEKTTPEPILKAKTEVTFNNDDILKSINRTFKRPPLGGFFGRGV